MALGHFVWFSLRTPKPAESQAFLERVFGWTVETHKIGQFPLRLLKNRDGILGSLNAVESARGVSRWIGALSVADVEAIAAAFEAKGGAILNPASDIQGFGRYAVVRDPQGAVMGLFAPNDPAADSKRGQPGFWAWNELMARDDAAAVAFYREIFGFGHRFRRIGQDRTYHVMMSGEMPACGIIKAPSPTFPTMWVPYVTVTDCNAATASAKAAGARILAAPRDAPGIGRISVFLDPSNAPMGAMQFAAPR